MDYFISVLNKQIGKFVCEDAGIYRGQCPQWIRYLLIICGVEWNGRTGNGKEVIDTLVNEYGGYYGESKYGYRICSAENKYDSNGHCWLEVKEGDKWIRYEQNVENAGTKSANYGCGTVYSVSKTDKARPSYLYNVRYAASPSIDLVIKVHTKKPDPEPVKDDTPDWFIDFIHDMGNFLNNYKKG